MHRALAIVAVVPVLGILRDVMIGIMLIVGEILRLARIDLPLMGAILLVIFDLLEDVRPGVRLVIPMSEMEAILLLNVRFVQSMSLVRKFKLPSLPRSPPLFKLMRLGKGEFSLPWF